MPSVSAWSLPSRACGDARVLADARPPGPTPGRTLPAVTDVVPPPPGSRAPLPPGVVRQIREERQHPRLTQWDGLHLRAVRDAIDGALRRLPPPDGPYLDVWCGAKPYDVLLGPHGFGIDIDRHFGGADVLSRIPFPLRDACVELALCSQALHILPPDVAEGTLRELHRVLRPGGHVVVTVPGTMLRLGPSSIEGRSTAAGLAARFNGWEDVRVERVGGFGVAFAHGAGLLLDTLCRRLRLPRLVGVLAPVVNLLGQAIDAVPGSRARAAHILVLTARRGPDS